MEICWERRSISAARFTWSRLDRMVPRTCFGEGDVWVDAQSWPPSGDKSRHPAFSMEFRATDWEEDTQGQLVNLTGEIIDRRPSGR